MCNWHLWLHDVPKGYDTKQGFNCLYDFLLLFSHTHPSHKSLHNSVTAAPFHSIVLWWGRYYSSKRIYDWVEQQRGCVQHRSRRTPMESHAGLQKKILFTERDGGSERCVTIQKRQQMSEKLCKDEEKNLAVYTLVCHMLWCLVSFWNAQIWAKILHVLFFSVYTNATHWCEPKP